MDDSTREQMMEQLDELRAQVKQSGAHSSQDDVTLLEKVEELQTLVASERDAGLEAKSKFSEDGMPIFGAILNG